MAARRMILTRFFKDPDIMNLSSKDTQLILIGLVLAADDEGREVAHAGMLGREMDYPVEQVEAALQELASNDLLVLYQVGKHRYYQLSRAIRGWQTLGGRTTPSRYPAPPASDIPESEPSAEQAGKSRGKVGENLGKSRGNSQNFPDQVNLTEVNLTEDGESHIREVVPSSSPPTSTNDASAEQGKIITLSSAKTRALTQQTARILKLPVTEALTRLVAEYAQVASLSLPGEADAAREWIDDPQRNKKHRRMSPAFFRNWLKREQDAIDRRQLALQQARLSTGTAGPTPPSRDAPPAGRRPPDLMHLADEDRHTERTKGEKR